MSETPDPEAEAGQKLAASVTMTAGGLRILHEVLRRRRDRAAKATDRPEPGPKDTPAKREEVVTRWALEGRAEDRALVEGFNPDLVHAHDMASETLPPELAMPQAAMALEMAETWDWDELDDGSFIGRRHHDGVEKLQVLSADEDGVYTLTDAQPAQEYRSGQHPGRVYSVDEDGTIDITDPAAATDTAPEADQGVSKPAATHFDGVPVDAPTLPPPPAAGTAAGASR